MLVADSSTHVECRKQGRARGVSSSCKEAAMKHRINPEGNRLPIKLDSTSNGEFAPVPLSPANLAANRLAHELASAFCKKTNLTRRGFLVSACGAASTLLAFNAANAAAGRRGGFFDIARDAALADQVARV